MSDPRDDSETGAGSTHSARSNAMNVCAVMLVLFALYYARTLVVPLVTALFAYLTLRPIVRHLRRLHIPPSVSAAGVMITLAGTLSIATYAVVEPAQQLVANAPKNMAVVKERLAFVFDKMNEFNDATQDIAEVDDDSKAVSDSEPVPVEVKQPAWSTNLSIATGTGSIVSFLTISGVLLYFLLASGDDVIRSIMRALPNLTARKQLVGMIENVQDGLGSYLAHVTVINACLGIAVGVAMWMLEMPSPVMWGVMAMAFNFIPIVGAICGGVVIFLVALINFEPTYYAFVVSGVYLTLTTLEGQFITPSVLGRSMEISPILVFLSICVWGWMWGLMGVFLSVPILIAARMASEQYIGLTPMATVLGARVDQKHDAESPAKSSTTTDPVATKPAATPN